MSSPKSIARIFIAYSNNPKRTLILRRGPAKYVAIFNWDRTKDKFSLGQWLKGRIYEHRLDISPDGEHWIYLGLQGGMNSHTVIAKTPYLKAIDFYPWCGIWGGGGHFITSKKYALAGNEMEDSRVSGRFIVERHAMQRKRGLYNRLIRHGWDAKLNGDFTIPLSKGWELRKHVGNAQKFGRSLESEWHTLSNEKLGLILKRTGWEWADINKGNLVFAEGGRLFRATLSNDTKQPYRAKLIHDFNPYAFKPIRAPY